MDAGRATLLKRRADRGQVTESDKQTFCLDLIPSKFFDCSCIMPEHNCLILRTQVQIPEYLNSKDKPMLEVRLLDGTVVNHISFTTLKKAAFSRTAANKLGWFVFNNFLYIVGSLTLEKVMLTGIFEDPMSVAKFQDCETGEVCYNDNMDYPIDSSLINALHELVIQRLLPTLNLPQDDENNARNSTIIKDEE